jgi:hypothetical protein
MIDISNARLWGGIIAPGVLAVIAGLIHLHIFSELTEEELPPRVFSQPFRIVDHYQAYLRKHDRTRRAHRVVYATIAFDALTLAVFYFVNA